jgi:hypothetical protein
VIGGAAPADGHQKPVEHWRKAIAKCRKAMEN